VEIKLHAFLTSVIDGGRGGERQRHCRVILLPKKERLSRDGLNDVEKMLGPAENRSRTARLSSPQSTVSSQRLLLIGLVYYQFMALCLYFLVICFSSRFKYRLFLSVINLLTIQRALEGFHRPN